MKYRYVFSLLLAFLVIGVGNLAAQDSLPTAEVTAESGIEFSYRNVHFTLDPALHLGSLTASTIPAVEKTEGTPYFGVLPEHLQFAFSRETELFFAPQLNVYPVDAYQNMGIDLIKPQIDALRALLKDRPKLDDPTDLPYLPLVNAGQMISAQAQYIEFGGGAGIRYLTAFHQAVMPITNEDLLYTFQGITDDGRSYVAARFPVSTTALPDFVQPGTEGEDFDPDVNRAEVTTTLNLLAPADVTPDLSLLDALIYSLVVTPAL